MKKYLFIFKSEVISEAQYVFNVLLSFIGYFIHIFIFLNLWKYVYSDSSQIINGYTLNQMVWYVIFTEVIWSIVAGRKVVSKISSDIKTGNIAYNINKPYDYIKYALFGQLGSSTIKGLIFIILSLLLGLVLLGSFPTLNLFSLLLVFIIFILAIIINLLFVTFIGLFAFIVEDANPFYWVYSKFILIIGTIFPIEYFPSFIQPLLKFSPIYALSYGPAKLFVNFNINEFVTVLLSQIIYLLFGYTICKLLYRKGVKKLNVNGG